MQVKETITRQRRLDLTVEYIIRAIEIRRWMVFSNIRMEDDLKGCLTSVIIFTQNCKSRYTTLPNITFLN
ncbi:hypothetical protein T07_1883 [Trichinella nelsoni]|uniref:Uncharacterized protein n=1 Tax=Trichinella nelsoni TaxID=6336 RepID=A0A0V0RSA9_9BILA|nr:hypothetical protein T07_12549 [Trichinella nelsoni]KRX17162.1 hypothetical protein T07_1883 [Trichinella nelsoni]